MYKTKFQLEEVRQGKEGPNPPVEKGTFRGDKSTIAE